MDLTQAFADGGFWMWGVLALGLAHWVTVAYQLVKVESVDVIPFLWGSVGATVLLGLLATLVGLQMGFSYLATLPAEEVRDKLLLIPTIALGTTVLSLIFAVPGLLGTGIAATMVRRRRRRRRAAE